MLRYFSALTLLLFLSCGPPSSHSGLKVLITGDVLLDRGVREEIGRNGVPHLFEHVSAAFKNADAVVVNLECPVTGIHAPINKKFIFRAEPEWLAALKNAGITHCDMANNHSCDQGRAGMTDTYHNIVSNGMQAIGYGADQRAAQEPSFICKGVDSLAIFASVLLPLENWSFLSDEPGISQATVEELCQNIRKLKQHSSAKVLVLLHWGSEFQLTASASQFAQAYALINAGADAVVGHHPHVIQNSVIYHGKPIYFSLGNFVFDQKTPDASKGLMLELSISDGELSATSSQVLIEGCVPRPVK